MRNPTALAALFLTLSLSVSGQGIVIDPPTLHRWAANRALADTLLDEAEGDYQSARRIVGGLRADLDTCSAIAQRSNERFEQSEHERATLTSERDKTRRANKRSGKGFAIASVVAVVEGALLYKTLK